ncbi:targeting protein for Xklp2 homolog isoform X1 [Neodiprion fabricii]|uniref:targeting protein for Xklp2 homolog isoform X1 n=1 Tax=Neodiprion fabricii TaxID=2872261 RepID=UPI001ED968C8|nr:targeting protein for Xklp2 homolog isoform X1 [Neodiprion fabricii]XP_046428546.1 targeting protein for Xklp2 homolog isoform X1 [Neodiprion fabricii]
MEIMASSSDTHFSLFASTYDSIESPQYISFADNIPEAKDSFFDRRNQDLSSKQLTNKHYQTLPNDVSDDFIRPLEKIGLKNPTKEQEKIITSTPFRVQGLEPFPWRVNSKPQAAPNLDKQKTGIKMQPFSFDERNKQLQQRKIERIKTVLQAEKDARKFRANPVPKFLQKISINTNTTDMTINSKLKHKCATENSDSAPPKFRARSPKVLRRPPFKPIVPKQPLMLPSSPILNSEQRAKERKIFDNYLKNKEQLEAELKQLKEAALKKREEEEILKMRKKMVPKAQPIRYFKSVQVAQVAKRPLTEPITPAVIKRQRR